jgi:hypothetical protein
MSVSPKLRYAVISTVLGGVLFALVADMSRFPGGWLGFSAFLIGVFVLALHLYDRLD